MDELAGGLRWAPDVGLVLRWDIDVTGVLDKDGQLIPELSVREARARIDDGTISGGMVKSASRMVNNSPFDWAKPSRTASTCPLPVC